MLDDTNHPALVQQLKLYLDTPAYGIQIDANMNRSSDKKLIDCRDRLTYWPISIKEKIQWFAFHSIVEHTACIIETDVSLIP